MRVGCTRDGWVGGTEGARRGRGGQKPKRINIPRRRRRRVAKTFPAHTPTHAHASRNALCSESGGGGPDGDDNANRFARRNCCMQCSYIEYIYICIWDGRWVARTGLRKKKRKTKIKIKMKNPTIIKPTRSQENDIYIILYW